MTINTTILTAALAKLATDASKDARELLEAGSYDLDVDVTVHVQGNVTVGEDHACCPTVAIPHKLAMALFCRYAGITGPTAMAALVRAMQEALAIGQLTNGERKTAEKAIRELADLEAAEQIVRMGLDALPACVRKGAVKVDGAITLSEPRGSIEEI